MTELERLQQRYNAFYKTGRKGNYNDDNGANCHAQELGSYRPYKIAVKVTAPGYAPALVDPEGFQYARYIGRLA